MQLQLIYGAARKAVSKEQMVPLLYRGARRWVAEAQTGFAGGQWDLAADRIHKAQAVIYELNAALDRTAEPQLTDSLQSLYSYWVRQLSAGLTQRDPQPLQEVAEYLEDLAVAWEEAARKVRVERSGDRAASHGN